jgi:hypothetical protein
MTVSKENVKLEQRLVKIQNSVAAIGAKVDALLGDKAGSVKLPTPEAEPQAVSSQPYAIKKEHELPVSTIEPPVVPAEGKTPAEAAEEEEAPKVDPSTIKPPVTPVPDDPNNPKTEEEKQKEAEEKSKEEVESAPSVEETSRRTPPTTTTSTSTPPRTVRPAQ